METIWQPENQYRVGPYSPKFGSKEPQWFLHGLGLVELSKFTTPFQIDFYDGAMRNGSFYAPDMGWQGPPAAPGTRYGGPWSEAADAEWNRRYLRPVLGGYGKFHYGPRFHGPAQWATYRREIYQVQLQAYDPATGAFVDVPDLGVTEGPGVPVPAPPEGV